MNENERLLKVLRRERVDRPPVIAPGGMMACLTPEILQTGGVDPVCAVTEADGMVRAAEAMREVTGFENLGLPFCLTVEAQSLGAVASCGTSKVEPLLLAPALSSDRDIDAVPIPRPFEDEHMAEVLSGISQLKQRHPDVPVIGNLSGPATLASSIIAEGDFFRMLLREPEKAKSIIALAGQTIIAFGTAMIESGADVITVSDPTACGEIIGPRAFEEHILPEFQRIFSQMDRLGARTILHICGKVTNLLPLIRETGADAFSVDSMMVVHTVRESVAPMAVMGNLSTRLLARETSAAVSEATRKVLTQGVDIVSPSCGLDRSTPLENIRAMCRTVKSGNGAQA